MKLLLVCLVCVLAGCGRNASLETRVKVLEAKVEELHRRSQFDIEALKALRQDIDTLTSKRFSDIDRQLKALEQ